MDDEDEPVSRGLGARPQWCVVVLTCSADEDDDGGGEDGDVNIKLGISDCRLILGAHGRASTRGRP